MRIVIVGAGAIGGVIGGRLHQHGYTTALIARGPHLTEIRRRGLRVEDPDHAVTVDVPVHGDVSEIGWRDGDVAVIATKSQDAVAALEALAAVAPPELPVICAQNGVDNEQQALRRFVNVYGIHVMCPATFLEPGVVQASSAPISGLLDVGRYPSGTDATSQAVAAALMGSRFDSRAVEDIMRWKYGKLLLNLGNAVQIVCGLGTGLEIAHRARQEGASCLEAAGVGFVSGEEDKERRGDLLTVRPVGGKSRGGGSTWQSATRGLNSIETDYLNGEIVLLGRLHGVPTPVNELLQRLAVEVVTGRRAAGSVSEAEILRRLGS
ncbi:ketopantoate reductase family protein [Phytoactinopolyspora mesophila]|uniref:Ketopantoate reductase family protein n=1 Tax=Phytoactinopolyspora mesophila TaxID=2650750 RepID=A0A7K3LYF7_9ACTN|nr:2-dehydropantoate 2-reductase N-terminal domain-containing protein [Phytoactinopolyspora mesophila]NDL56020.1 ketopantoate reductase family protein [Phytoactinopolyspora mesophila]